MSFADANRRVPEAEAAERDAAYVNESISYGFKFIRWLASGREAR
jgi:hypothetical protein